MKSIKLLYYLLIISIILFIIYYLWYKKILKLIKYAYNTFFDNYFSLYHYSVSCFIMFINVSLITDIIQKLWDNFFYKQVVFFYCLNFYHLLIISPTIFLNIIFISDIIKIGLLLIQLTLFVIMKRDTQW